jgi:hypothetical protein
VTPGQGEHPIRAARTQALFREVNEQVWALQQKWGTPAEVDFICECADETCSAPIQVASVEYERVDVHKQSVAAVAIDAAPSARRKGGAGR